MNPLIHDAGPAPLFAKEFKVWHNKKYGDYYKSLMERYKGDKEKLKSIAEQKARAEAGQCPYCKVSFYDHPGLAGPARNMLPGDPLVICFLCFQYAAMSER